MRRLSALLAVVLLVGAVPAYAGDSGARSAHRRVSGTPSAAVHALSVPTDDDIPGVGISASPIIGTLERGVDFDDVYSVYLEKGQRIWAAVDGAPDTDFDVVLFGPEATSVDGSVGLLKEAATGSYPDALACNINVSGVYYLDAYAYAGSGAYTLTYGIGEAVDAILGPDDDVPGVELPPAPVIGSLDTDTDHDDVYAVRLRAGDTLIASVTAEPWTDFDLYVYPPDATTVIDSPEWLEFAARATYPDGLRYTAKTAGTYLLDVWAYKGTGDYQLSWTVKRSRAVSAPSARRVVRRAKRFKVSGSVAPAAADGVTVRIYRWRKTATGAWKRYGFVNARANASGSYARMLSLPRRGVWKLRAYTAEDASHTAAWSAGADYVRVR